MLLLEVVAATRVGPALFVQWKKCFGFFAVQDVKKRTSNILHLHIVTRHRFVNSHKKRDSHYFNAGCRGKGACLCGEGCGSCRSSLKRCQFVEGEAPAADQQNVTARAEGDDCEGWQRENRV